MPSRARPGSAEQPRAAKPDRPGELAHGAKDKARSECVGQSKSERTDQSVAAGIRNLSCCAWQMKKVGEVPASAGRTWNPVVERFGIVVVVHSGGDSESRFHLFSSDNIS